MAISIKKSLFLAAALFFSSLLFSQNEDLKPPKFGGFENEVAVFPIHLNEIGSGASILFRRNMGETAIKNWRRNRSIRLVGSFFGQENHRDNLLFPRVISDSVIIDVTKSRLSERAVQIGFDWRWQKGRFEHWTGVDAGYHWGKSETHTIRSINDGGTQLPDQMVDFESDFYAPGVAIFWGCRAFLAPRFSVGMEIGLPFELHFTKLRSTNSTASASSFNSSFFDLGDSRPRFLFLAFHF